jgi:hypothetical protein
MNQDTWTRQRQGRESVGIHGPALDICDAAGLRNPQRYELTEFEQLFVGEFTVNLQ